MALPIIDKIIPLQTNQNQKKLPLSSMALESVKLIVVVGGGLVVGLLLPIDLSWVDTASEWILFLLLFFIGIQLRNSGLTLRQILLNKQGMAIAAVVIATCMLGGVLAAVFLDLPLYQALAMASGFGWYSLAGILMGDAFGPVFGGASFLIELMRELVALVAIPLFIRSYPCTAIGYAGATAMDFTLPVIQTTGGVRCVPVAIVSGFILSLLVPVMMLFFVSLAS
ncbi:putative surface protein [Vibrio sp. JCM 18904]|nr:putative surface protein [Vibrio sp. JCM 18904]